MADRFQVPSDPVSLRMENSLLAFEVDFLRGRLRDVATETDPDSLARTAALRSRVEHLEELVEELAKARSDLRWMLGRLNSSPAGPLLRRFEGFRKLLSRWVS